MGALLSLIPLIGQVLPHLIPALGTPLAGNILAKAGQIASDIFGTTDANAISLAIQQDQSKLDHFKAELDAQTQDEKLAFEDLQSARAQTVQLAGEHSALAWGAPIVSMIVAFGFFVALVMLFVLRETQLDPQVSAVMVALFGVLGSNFTQVVSYWVGSSRASLNKDAVLANLAVNTVPASALKAAMNGGSDSDSGAK